MADETQDVSQPTAGDAGQTPATPREAGDGQGSFTPEYVKSLRDENAKRRTELRALEEQVKKLASLVAPEDTPAKTSDAVTIISQRLDSLTASLKDFDQRADRQARYHALREEGIKAGVIDLDAALKLVDPTAVTVDPDGAVKGAPEAIAALAAAKPYLFNKNTPAPNAGATLPAQTRDDSINAIQKRVRDKLSNPFDDLSSFGRDGGLVLPWEG